MNPLTIALRSEIARVARKELKDELTALRKATFAHRSEIAAVKRELKTLRSQLTANERAIKSLAPSVMPKPEIRRDPKLRFSAKALATQRAKLGLTQAQMARLLGASSLSVYKWESGKVHPRAAQLERIFAIRRLGKREAATLLAKRESPGRP